MMTDSINVTLMKHFVFRVGKDSDFLPCLVCSATSELVGVEYLFLSNMFVPTLSESNFDVSCQN